MGMSKVVVVSPTKVKFVHQLDGDGKSYAEDITIELQEGVDPSRFDWWVQKNGEVGVANVSFSSYGPPPEGLQFPE